MTETPLVHLDNIVLRFGDKTVLDGIDLKVFSKDRLVVLGQSGSGKSTTLRLILGILKPTSGVVRYRHLQVQRLSRSKLNLLRSRIGMVYQYSALISSLTVRENLALPIEELGRSSRKEIDALIEQNLAIVGMSGTEENMPSELSSGMRKRVSLARDQRDAWRSGRRQALLILLARRQQVQGDAREVAVKPRRRWDQDDGQEQPDDDSARHTRHSPGRHGRDFAVVAGCSWSAFILRVLVAGD